MWEAGGACLYLVPLTYKRDIASIKPEEDKYIKEAKISATEPQMSSYIKGDTSQQDKHPA